MYRLFDHELVFFPDKKLSSMTTGLAQTMLNNSLLSILIIPAGNVGSYLMITKGLKREFRLSDFFRSNLNMLVCLLLMPSFSDPNLFLKSVCFIVFMAVVNTAIDCS